MTTTADRLASPRHRVLRSATGKILDLWRARELLSQLVSKELKVRYKSSALGFLWSMLTPALMTLVFSAVFTMIVRVGVVNFPAFFVAGYVLWQFHHNSCQGALYSVVGNADLVNKVYFPREVLPLSHVLSQMVHLLLALLVFSPYLVYTRGWGVVAYLPATLVAIALLALFTSGVAMWFAGVNVVFRDLQELFVVIFQVWFYATPIIYPLALVSVNIRPQYEWIVTLLQLNPMTWFVEVFRAPLYGVVVPGDEGGVVSLAPSWPAATSVVVASAWAVGAFVLGYAVFLRRARSFAKEV